MNLLNIKQRLIEARVRKGVTVRCIADYANISERQARRVFSTTEFSGLDWYKFHMICEFLEVTTSEVVTGQPQIAAPELSIEEHRLANHIIAGIVKYRQSDISGR